MNNLAEKMAEEIAERLNGGEFEDGKWYTDGQRTAWINAVRPFADEIKKLRLAILGITPFAEWQLMEMTAERNPAPLANAIKIAKDAVKNE